MDTLFGAVATATAKLRVAGSLPSGQAAVIVNQSEATDIFTASASGAPRFTVTTDGDLVLGGTSPVVISNSVTNAALELNAHGTGTLTLNNGATGNLQFFSSSNTLSSAGSLTLAGDITLTSGGTVSTTANANLVLDAGSGVVAVNGNSLGLNYDASVNNVLNFTVGPGAATDDLYWGNSKLCESTDASCGWATPSQLVNFWQYNSTTGIIAPAAVIVNQSESQDIFTASASGVAKFSIQSDGDLVSSADTLTASSLATLTSAVTLGVSATTLNLGNGSAATIGTLSDDNLTIAPNGTGILTLDPTGAGSIAIGSSDITGITLITDNGAVNDIALTGGVTITGVEGSDKLTLSQGDVAVSDGSLTVTDDDNAASFSVVNNTANTIGAGVAGGINVLSSTSLSTGDLLELQLTESALSTGNYLNAWDVTAGASVFRIGEDGIVTAGTSSVVWNLATGFFDADAITLAPSGTTGSTSSRSGLQTNLDGLTLLMGCADNEILKWTDAAGWSCATDAATGGSTIWTQTGIVIAPTTSTSRLNIGTGAGSTARHNLFVDGPSTTADTALVAFNNTTAGADILTASSAGTTKFTLTSAGSVNVAAAGGLDTVAAGALNVGSTTATSIAMGNANTTTITLGSSTATSVKFVDSTTGPNTTNWAAGSFAIGALGTGATQGRVWLMSGTTKYSINSNAATIADYSEYMLQQTPGQAEPGDILVLDQGGSGKVKPAASAYDSQILGAVTTSSRGTSYNDLDYDNFYGTGSHGDDPAWTNVGMLGQVYVKLSLENGPITAGDPITTSTVPGVGMKASQTGRILGYALQPWDGTQVRDSAAPQQSLPEGQNILLVLVNPSWSENPTDALNLDDVNLNGILSYPNGTLNPEAV
ncbi:MAG: hypothetical protein HYT14_02795, partial [Candidatus Liptonbacteria bacterium]|nr:hypothetical protein [Candidatus Liptonbacteria bacterium]